MRKNEMDDARQISICYKSGNFFTQISILLENHMALLPAVFGVILSEDQTALLLVKRRDVPLWTLPGGGKEDHETNEAALQREIEEETGCKITIIRQCATYHPINQLGSLTSVYVCQIQSGHFSLSNETVEIAFHPLVQLPQSFFHIHAIWVNEALTHTTSIDRDLTEVSYSALLKYFIRHPWYVMRFAWTRFFAKGVE